MASSLSSFLLPFLLLVLVSPTFLHESQLFVNGNLDLIRKTCKNTNYYNTCVSSLKSNSSSFKSDTKGLAVIMIGIGMANATSTYSYLSSQLLSSSSSGSSSSSSSNSSDTLLLKKVLKECVEKYSYANDALQGSLEELDFMNFDYAYVQVTAAKDYPYGCRNAYKRSPGLVYPLEMMHREEGFEHICDIALAIINLLINMSYR